MTLYPFVMKELCGHMCQNDVLSTSIGRDDVASTSMRHHFYAMCLLGKFFKKLYKTNGKWVLIISLENINTKYCTK